MNISLRQLHAFQAVAHSGGFSRAGAALGLTQPAISRSITELEQALGVQLFHRTTRAVELTDAGRLLHSRVGSVLDDLDACLQEVQGLATQKMGTVRVASSPTLSAHLMPQCIARCQQQYPGLKLQLLDRIQSDVLHSVRSGEVDFGLVIEPTDSEDLECESILSEPFCLVCPDSHVLAQAAQLRWADLCEQHLVLLDHASGSRRLIDAALLAHGARASVVQDVGHTTTIFSMVEAGLGITVVPQLAVPKAWAGVPGRARATPGNTGQGPVVHRLVSRPLLPKVERRIMLVHRRQRNLGPLAQRVWQLVRELAAQP